MGAGTRSLEYLEQLRLDRSFWNGKRVLVTGHTGFKGGWLSAWLIDMGATVGGFAHKPYTPTSFFELNGLERRMVSMIGDIRYRKQITSAMASFKPEIVFHLAAQALVRRSYRDPIATFETNTIGTANVLEAVRAAGSVKSVVVVTSDKCYENPGTSVPLRETDELGGRDPYSASKGCAELVASCYRRSFLEEKGIALATARAGNVIGGGDWSEERLIPDAVRALAAHRPLVLRNPESIRPWQHVFEPLSGYLLLGQKLYEGKLECAEAWNFGPNFQRGVPVREVVETMFRLWKDGSWVMDRSDGELHEAHTLFLDGAKARERLGWRTILDLNESLALTVAWYLAALVEPRHTDDCFKMSLDQLHGYENKLIGYSESLSGS